MVFGVLSCAIQFHECLLLFVRQVVFVRVKNKKDIYITNRMHTVVSNHYIYKKYRMEIKEQTRLVRHVCVC